MNKKELIEDVEQGYLPQFIGFWTTKEIPGEVGPWVLSNFHQAPFKEELVNGEEYLFSCVEQFMMYHKAVTFQDYAIAEQILGLWNVHASQYKKLGRKVKNFDADVWSEVSRVVVFGGLLQKFKQNPELKDYLISTGEAVIVEDSPFDKIWGIGMRADSPDFTHPKKWPGENRLGFLLMMVRDHLKKEA